MATLNNTARRHQSRRHPLTRSSPQARRPVAFDQVTQASGVGFTCLRSHAPIDFALANRGVGLDTAVAGKRTVSRTTVGTHVQLVLTKLGVHFRLEAASFAACYHLLEDSSRRARD